MRQFISVALIGKVKEMFCKSKKLKLNLVGVGCAAHIVHNAIRNALDVEIASIAVQIYANFYIHAIRTEAWKSICEICEDEYDQLVGYCKTRFIGLWEALRKIISNVPTFENIFRWPSFTPQKSQMHLPFVFVHEQVKIYFY